MRSDGGPAFRDAFAQELDKLGVKHVLSSSFNPQSNGAAERVVRSLREVLEKRGVKKTTQLEISDRDVPNPNNSTESEFIRKRIVPFLINRIENMNIRIRLLINRIGV